MVRIYSVILYRSQEQKRKITANNKILQAAVTTTITITVLRAIKMLTSPSARVCVYIDGPPRPCAAAFPVIMRY